MNDLSPSGPVNIFKFQILAIIGSIALFLFILLLIRRKKIKEEYSLLWLFFSIVFIVLSFWRDGLDVLSKAIGVAYPPTAIMILLLMAMFVILIQFSTIISKLSESNKNLTQELGLLKQKMEELEAKADKKADA